MTVKEYAEYLLANFDHNLPVVKAVNEKDITNQFTGEERVREVWIIEFPNSVRIASDHDQGSFVTSKAVLL